MKKEITNDDQKNQVGLNIIAMVIYFPFLIWNILSLGFGIFTGEFFLDNANFAINIAKQVSISDKAD